jgi:hypothetical protein
MRRVLREFALAIGGIGVGTVLFIIASSHVYFNEAFYISWGYPWPWHFAGDTVMATPFPFGFDVGAVAWSAFYLDLAFWLALPIAAIQFSARIAVPYVIRFLKIRREKRGVASASVYGFLESPE